MESVEHIPVVNAYIRQEGSWWMVGLEGVTGRPPYGPFRTEDEARAAVESIGYNVRDELTMLGHLQHHMTYTLPTIKTCLESLGLAFWKTEGT